MSRYKVVAFICLLFVSVGVLGAFGQTSVWPLSSVVLNVVPGFGLGSFFQGDILSGLILLGADAAGWGFLFAGLAASLQNITLFGPPAPSQPATYSTLIYVGAVVLVLSKIAGIALPIIYYQRKKSVSFELEPSIDENQNPLLRCCFRLQT